MKKLIANALMVLAVLTVVFMGTVHVLAQNSTPVCVGEIPSTKHGDLVILVFSGGTNPRYEIGTGSKEDPYAFTYELGQYVHAFVNFQPVSVNLYPCGGTFTCVLSGFILPEEVIIPLEPGANLYEAGGMRVIEGFPIPVNRPIRGYSLSEGYDLNLDYFSGLPGYLPTCQPHMNG